MPKYKKTGARVHTNQVYSASAHGEAFKAIPPSGRGTRLQWESKTRARVHPRGRLHRSTMTQSDYRRMGINAHG